MKTRHDEEIFLPKLNFGNEFELLLINNCLSSKPLRKKKTCSTELLKS